jgi:hypothetical protein
MYLIDSQNGSKFRTEVVFMYLFHVFLGIFDVLFSYYLAALLGQCSVHFFPLRRLNTVEGQVPL